MRRTASPLLAVLAALPVVAASEPPGGPQSVSLTVYSAMDLMSAEFDKAFDARWQSNYGPSQSLPGYGVVREHREVELRAGLNELSIADVASGIDASTVSFEDLTAPSTTVIEQKYLYDLISAHTVLMKYLGREVTFNVARGSGRMETITGRLLTVDRNGTILETARGIEVIDTQYDDFRVPSLPAGLYTRPTLLWRVNSPIGGKHRIETTYQTRNMVWRADYTLVLDEQEATADLGAWVTLVNRSGASYQDAKLKLVAGDVQRVQPRPGIPAGIPMGPQAPPGFEEKSFFEYHLYTLPRPVSVPDNSTQQLTLFPTARGVHVRKLYVLGGPAPTYGYRTSPVMEPSYRPTDSRKVDVLVEMDNTEANRLGIALPKGKVKLYKRDPADGAKEFIGEDLIDHTPRDETIRVRVGQAFDIAGERSQTDFKTDQQARTMTESFRIELRNHKAVPVRILVREPLYRWTNWSVLDNSEPFEKIDARTIEYKVDVPANGSKAITYTARYTW